jgi:predicted helicase
MDAVEEGIVSIITNHSWLDNTTFRGMRQSLMRSFDQIYVLDLHGNAKKKERAPDGGKDENVFDIEQGVAISLFVKRKGLEKGVWRRDLWGSRLEKYKNSAQETLKNVGLTRLLPLRNRFLFSFLNENLRQQYEEGIQMPDILKVNVLGFQTHRDEFSICFSEKDIEHRIAELRDIGTPAEKISNKYKS